jgi:nucleoside-diphosphate kinase
VIIKPEAVVRNISMEILARFERSGLKIVGLKLLKATREIAELHYTYEDIAVRHGERVRNQLLDYITSGSIIVCVLAGVSAISVVRKLCGSTEPSTAIPGTIRGDYAHVSYAFCNDAGIAVENIIHASATSEEASREITLWFTERELHVN